MGKESEKLLFSGIKEGGLILNTEMYRRKEAAPQRLFKREETKTKETKIFSFKIENKKKEKLIHFLALGDWALYYSNGNNILNTDGPFKKCQLNAINFRHLLLIRHFTFVCYKKLSLNTVKNSLHAVCSVWKYKQRIRTKKLQKMK